MSKSYFSKYQLGYFSHLCSPIWKWFFIPHKWPTACGRGRKKLCSSFPQPSQQEALITHPVELLAHASPAVGWSQWPIVPLCSPQRWRKAEQQLLTSDSRVPASWNTSFRDQFILKIWVKLDKNTRKYFISVPTRLGNAENTSHWQVSLQFIEIGVREKCFTLCKPGWAALCAPSSLLLGALFPLLDGASDSLLRRLLSAHECSVHGFIVMASSINRYSSKCSFASLSANFWELLLFFTQSWLYGVRCILHMFIFLVFLLYLFYALLLLLGTC